MTKATPGSSSVRRVDILLPPRAPPSDSDGDGSGSRQGWRCRDWRARRWCSVGGSNDDGNDGNDGDEGNARVVPRQARRRPPPPARPPLRRRW